jgi:hypothetical protein
MADTLKVLGQSAPLAATLTPIYTVPAATSTTVSSLVVCNRGVGADSFRVSIAIAGAADANAQYLYWNLPLGASDSYIATIGLTLAATDVVRVYAGTANLSFQLFGVEVT